MRWCIRILASVILFTILSGCEKTNTVTVEVNPLLDSTATVVVGRVIDGDTFEIGFGRDSFAVRILGIDAFETRHDARLDSQAVHAHISVDSAYALGLQAKKFADSLLTKQSVLLVRDYKQPPFDSYTRLLRHVYYYQGSATIDFGALLLQKKLAVVDTL